MKLNKVVKTPAPKTSEGATAARDSVENKLRKALMTCLLWEDMHYEKSDSVAARIQEYVPKLSFEKIAEIAIEAKEESKLRHAPLLVAAVAVSCFNGKKVGDLISRVIQRPDEMGELISIYWKITAAKSKMIPRQMKIGIARAFKRFNEYSLAKYNSNTAGVKLRDVVFLCKVRAGEDKEFGNLLARLVNKTFVPKEIAAKYEVKSLGLVSPETWENRLSRGEDKKQVFESLLSEGKLGATAFLKNLRNMQEAGVQESLIRANFSKVKTEKILPFSFVTAARYAPRWNDELNTLMLRCLKENEKLQGKTCIVVDVSGSMLSSLSAKSELNRLTAAASAAALIREVCDNVVVYATGSVTKPVKNYRGLPLIAEIERMYRECGGGGIFLTPCMQMVYKEHPDAERIIVITDEQDCGQGKDSPANAKAFGKNNYLINVATYENGVNFSKWTQINGWSEHLLRYIVANEAVG